MKIMVVASGEEIYYKTSIEELDDSEETVLGEIDNVPENMSFNSYRKTLPYLIYNQEVAIKQCETAIRRLEIRKKVLALLLNLKKEFEDEEE